MKKLPADLTRSFNFAEQNLFFLTFANLIADGTTGFARRLARRLTFAATALLNRGLKIRLVDCLDVFHVISSQKILSRAVNYEVRDLLKRKAYGSFQRQRQIDSRRFDMSFRSRPAVVNRVRGMNNFYRVRSTTKSAICSRAKLTEVFSVNGRLIRADSI